MDFKLKDFNVGNIIRVFVKDSGEISTTQTTLTMPATVLVITASRVLIGWGATDDMMPNGSLDLAPLKVAGLSYYSGIKSYLPTWEQYLFGTWLPLNMAVCLGDGTSSHSGETEGHFCTGCAQDYPYAIHNPMSGPFVCSGCKLVRSAWN